MLIIDLNFQQNRQFCGNFFYIITYKTYIYKMYGPSAITSVRGQGSLIL